MAPPVGIKANCNQEAVSTTLQDALTESTDTKQSQREIDGQTYFDYEIFSPVLVINHPMD